MMPTDPGRRTALHVPKRHFPAMATTLALVAIVTACGSTESAAGDGARGAGQGQANPLIAAADRPVAPTISGVGLDGANISLDQLRGKVVVLNAWGSWCAPCRAEAPSLEAVYQDTQARGVAFLGIDVRDNDAAARSFQRTFAVSYPSIPDRGGQIIASFRELPPNAIPTTLILDRKGRIAARFIGGITKDELESAVNAASTE